MAPVIILIGSGIVGLGVVWFFAYSRSRVVSEGLLRDALRREPTELYRVVVPVANPETQHGLLRLAAATAHANVERGTPELVAVNVTEGPRDPALQNIESDRLDYQRTLLDNAHDIAEEMEVRLRTRSIVAPNVGEAILEVIDEEAADQVLFGWDGTVDQDEHVFGSMLDPVVKHAQCDVSLVKLTADAIGNPVALVAPGTNAPVVARRAAEFATVDGTVPTLLYVQPDGADEFGADQSGYSVVTEIAESADLDVDDYEIEVLLDQNIESAIISAIDGYDTICIGLSQRTDGSRIVFGSITEQVAEEATGNIAMIRGSAGFRQD